jgi:hypothetical protein
MVLGSLMGYTCAIVYNQIFDGSVTACMMAVVGAGAVLAGVTHTLSVGWWMLKMFSLFFLLNSVVVAAAAAAACLLCAVRCFLMLRLRRLWLK